MSKIDLSQPPYQVPCPDCRAFAMAPCRDKTADLTQKHTRGVHAPGAPLAEPHDVRWTAWARNPSLRVKVTNDTWVRWCAETFEEWAARMTIHCPTARTYRELMFFAAEKLDMTTADYLRQYFPELMKVIHVSQPSTIGFLDRDPSFPPPKELSP